MPAFLGKEEAAIIFAHIERDRGDAQTEQFGWKDMFSHLRDWKVWEFGSYVFLNVGSTTRSENLSTLLTPCRIPVYTL